MPTGPSRNSPSLRSRRGMHRRTVTGVSERTFARRNSSTNCLISHSPRTQRLVKEAVRDAGQPGRGSSPRSSRLAPDGRLHRLQVAGPYRMAVVTASLTARTRSSTTSPEMVAGSCCKLVGRCAATRQGRPAMRRGDFPAMARCRRCGRYGLVAGPAGPGSTAPSRDEDGSGLALAQLILAAEPASRVAAGPEGGRRPPAGPALRV